MTIDKAYDPKAIESKWYELWEKEGYFNPDNHSQNKHTQKHELEPAYCIMIPPPNVTGSLHMGHAFQQTLMDVLIRYHRMKGCKTLWQVGTDHAGIATQMVVERQLLQENHSKESLGREAFVDRIWQWKATSGGHITRQLRRLGSSVDWSRERFTLDEGLSNAVLEAFIRLYDEGLIYKGKRLVNWDPVLHTAVSDLEVESEEEESFLYYIHYPLVDNPKQFVTVATTRPETLLGDVAVAVHPEDPRFKSLIGKKVQLPLTDRVIPIIGDSEVIPEFGTGCVKITPAHDFNDYAMAERHKLPFITILTFNATLNDCVPPAYQGLDRYVAREKIVNDLKLKNLIEKIEPYKLKIPRGDRSGAVLEPMLTDQWFVSIKSLAEPAIRAVEDREITFIPDNWSKTYFDWMHNIQDWCISRQLWWGHRIPAWYDEKGNVYVGRNEQEIRQNPKYKDKLTPKTSLRQEEDVLDTWFSSALWPFSTLGWPEKTTEFKTFYPTQVLVTGFDIIFFWVARMIMFGLKFTGKIPFHEVYIHGLIQDQDGNKMSKTKGNVIDPIDLIDGIDLESLVIKRTHGLMQPKLADSIEKLTRKQFPNGIPAYGTDALRFTFCALATTGRHIRFDLNRIEGYRHFCNKLWNAARFIQMNIPNKLTQSNPQKLNLVDTWILSRFQRALQAIEEHLDQYRFDLAAQTIYEFTWHEFCDWYLELSKPTLQINTSDPESQFSTQHTLITVFEALLRVLHPFIPYITEEIWQPISRLLPNINNNKDTLMLQPYPEFSKELLNETAESDIQWIQAVILGIRNIRGELNISPAKPIPVFFYNGDSKDQQKLENHQTLLQALAKLEKITWLEKKEAKPPASTALVGHLEILVPLAGLIDTEVELRRLQKELDKYRKELMTVNQKLSNDNFIKNAPAAIVESERKRCTELEFSIQKIQEQLNTIQNVNKQPTIPG